MEQIINLVAEVHFGQIFITDTDKSHIDTVLRELDIATESSIFYVQDGKIAKSEAN